jgi:hypothetical protein
MLHAMMSHCFRLPRPAVDRNAVSCVIPRMGGLMLVRFHHKATPVSTSLARSRMRHKTARLSKRRFFAVFTRITGALDWIVSADRHRRIVRARWVFVHVLPGFDRAGARE